MDTSLPRFAFVTFTRVFDTETRQEWATLPELVRMFRRFEVRPQTQQRVDKELRRIDVAEDAWRRRKEHGGAVYRELAKTAAHAQRQGQDTETALTTKLAELRKNAAAIAKRDLHLWSPALYRPGAKRGKEGVQHVSCLVLDYDAGVSIAEATATWRQWFHLLHTTWSHTPERPRFRMILPLAAPVLAHEWEAVARWAEERTGFRIDPTGKSASSTFALPAVGSEDSPCLAICQPGELLDPVVEGLVQQAAQRSEQPFTPAADSIIGGFPGKTYIEPARPGTSGSNATATGDSDNDDPFEDQGFWDSFHDLSGEPEPDSPAQMSPTPPTSAPQPPNASTAAAESALQARISGQIAEIERLLRDSHRASFVDALERLAALHDSGALTKEEFRLAKERLLRGDGEG